MRSIAGLGAFVAALTFPVAAWAAVIQVSPADGNGAYAKIEGAGPGDEVVIAPGTYAFRVYLQGRGTEDNPIYIHAQDPNNPPIWDPGGLVDDAPGSYTAGDKARGCWQVSGGTSYHIDGIVFRNCRAADYDSAGLRYYSGTSGLLITNCLFEDNDNGLTGGTENSEAMVEYSEFANNGNTGASTSSPTHNVYVYGGTFGLSYSYLHDPVQGQNLHCRAVTSTISYNWFDRAKSYVGDLMTSDDYANAPSGSITQTMILEGNVIIQGAAQANTGQIWAVYNDEASGSPVSFQVVALYNTVVGAGAHAAFLHLSNADGTPMTAYVSDNIISGTSQPLLVEDDAHGMVFGQGNWLQTGATLTGQPSFGGSVFGSSPGFTDAATQDYELAPGSACIGAASALGDLPGYAGPPASEYFQNEMVARMRRVRATAMDLGAFEHTTTGPGIGPYDDGGVMAAVDAGATVDATAGSEGGTPGMGVDASPSGNEGGDGAAGSQGKASSSAGCGCRVMPAGARGTSYGSLAILAATALLGRRRSRDRQRARSILPCAVPCRSSRQATRGGRAG
jgi:hypothetical protein